MTVAARPFGTSWLTDVGQSWPGSPGDSTSITEGEVVPVPTGLEPVDLDHPRTRAAFSWAQAVIDPIRLLPPGWDSHSAAPLDSWVGRFGIGLLATLAIQRVNPPQVFPTADGGLSLEWHRPDIDLVIYLSPPTEEPSSAFLRWNGSEWEVPDLFGAPDPRVNEVLSALRAG
jgi:hypothetical protein